MTTIFVSHASKDDLAVKSLETWLTSNGFTDLFVDHTSIKGGSSWAAELKKASKTCRVVLAVVTPNWLASDRCNNEFQVASLNGKAILPLLALPTNVELDAAARSRLDSVKAEVQGIDIWPCFDMEGRLSIVAEPDISARLSKDLRALGALTKVGLDPEAFEIDRNARPTPFPGLSSFGDDDADAALLYGRSREIVGILEQLRQMRARGEHRPLIIHGASGAGKSSLLRAGIIPRLRRETPAWLPLRAFRPGADPLLNFGEALARTHAEYGCTIAHGTIRDALMHAWTVAERGSDGNLNEAGRKRLRDTLDAEGRLLREAAGRPDASILISIDQAEELTRGDDRSGAALADVLRVALDSPPWSLALTVRTDSLAEMQSHPRFQNLEALQIELRALKAIQFENVVVEPAKRYGVEIDEELVEALGEDAPKDDALPLLAFAMQRLWSQYTPTGRLTKDNYDKVGKLQVLIEDAAERALCGIGPAEDVALRATPLSARREDMARSAFVPALVGSNDRGVLIRHTADWSSFSDEQKDILDRFSAWRLLVRKGSDAGGTVEVVHDTLLKTWKRLDNWLGAPERARLEALRSLQVDAWAWERNGRDAAYLNLRGKRLEYVAGFAELPLYSRRLEDLDASYLAACRQAEKAARLAASKRSAVIVVACFAIGSLGWLRQYEIQEFLHRWAFMTIQVLKADEELKLTRGAEFSECSPGCPTMIVVPAGEFNMGSDRPDYRGQRIEHPETPTPVHHVTIPRDFAVSKYAVKFSEYDACVDAGACPGPKPSDSGWGRSDRPVINVSWDNAKKYVAWLSRSTRKVYRLLSEAEWEYAARAGTKTEYPWGDEIGVQNANCEDCGSDRENNNRRTVLVDNFNRNAFGLYQMHGNVWQWVEDCYGVYGKKPEALNQTGGAWTWTPCDRRVVRGGAWGTPALELRSAFRYKNSPGDSNDDLGIRIARDLTR